MKKILAVLLIVFAFQACKNSNLDKASVEDVLNNPNKFLSQEIKVEGVVSLSNSDKRQFSIIGEKEFKECGIGECNVNEQLPIRYKSKLPQIGDKVEVLGHITKTKEGFIYEAKTIRNIKDIPAK